MKKKWLQTGFFIVMFGLCLGLGIWQWEKSALLQMRLIKEQAAPVVLTQDNVSTLKAFQPVTLSPPFTVLGYVHLLHQYQGGMHAQKAGVRVFAVIKPGNLSDYWLVDRGFWETKPPNDRNHAPMHITPLTGILIDAWKNPFVKQSFPLKAGPVVDVETLDLDSLSRLWHHPVSHWILKLDEAHEDTLGFIQRAPHLTPERHMAYAVQWWGLAAVIAIGWMVSRRRV